MANLSAALNALASSSVVDFYRPFVRPQAEESHYMRVSRGLTLVWGVVLILIAVGAQHLHQSVLELALTIASVPYGSMLGIFLLGVLTRRATGSAALIGALAGLGVLLLVIAFTSIAWTWYVAIGACTTFLVGLVAS
jgi:Na+/proline symporter